jgi:hypothetical protein
VVAEVIELKGVVRCGSVEGERRLRFLDLGLKRAKLTSLRFAKTYAGLGADAVRLQGIANIGAAFADLPESDKVILVTLIEKRQPGFMQDIAHVQEIVCVEWTKDELLATDAIPAMSPRRRLRYCFDGKANMVSLGSFPAVSLLSARKKQDDAKRLLATGIISNESCRQWEALAPVCWCDMFAQSLSG